MKLKSSEVSLNINKIAQSLRKNAEMLEPLSGKCCIYRAPPNLHSKETFTPELVSIGPYHHGEEKFKSMETHKLRYLNAFLERINRTMEEFVEGLKELEIHLRESYAEIDGYNREKFIEIMAVDGAFLMQYLLVIYYEDFQFNDRIFGRPFKYYSVIKDLLLIENQLPFFYLEHLFSMYKESNNADEEITFMKIMQAFVRETTFQSAFDSTDYIVTEVKQVCHILHLLTIYMPQSQRKETKQSTRLSTPTISMLHQAGVKFQLSSTKCISFDNGVLEIPKLTLMDETEQLLRNMQAFMQCHFLFNHVSDYISMMHTLINSGDDVRVLVKCGIIENWLEDNQAAATVFNNLSKGNAISSSKFSYAHVIEDLDAYYKTRRHKWKATLKQNYCKNPWTIISVVAASFLLLLTVTQTVFSVLQGV